MFQYNEVFGIISTMFNRLNFVLLGSDYYFKFVLEQNVPDLSSN